jgi:hypothetical protein
MSQDQLQPLPEDPARENSRHTDPELRQADWRQSDWFRQWEATAYASLDGSQRRRQRD